MDLFGHPGMGNKGFSSLDCLPHLSTQPTAICCSGTHLATDTQPDPSGYANHFDKKQPNQSPANNLSFRKKTPNKNKYRDRQGPLSKEHPVLKSASMASRQRPRRARSSDGAIRRINRPTTTHTTHSSPVMAVSNVGGTFRNKTIDGFQI